MVIGFTRNPHNGTGSLTQTYIFDSFGNQTGSSGSLTNPFRYTGREFDSENGLQFSRARYYDSNAGHFISEDPVRFQASTNFYRYTHNNPVLMNDPLGLKACIWVGDVDLYRYDTNENPTSGPWVFGAAGRTPGQRGPWGGSSSTPPGVNPKGVPWVLPNCMWHRDHFHDVIETTYFIKNFICFETTCDGTKVWPEFKFGSRRQKIRTRNDPETAVQPYAWGVDAPIYTEEKCLQLGPPNWK
jgi:RHS repeat-associated protein